jgi:hypothetical protein
VVHFVLAGPAGLVVPVHLNYNQVVEVFRPEFYLLVGNILVESFGPAEHFQVAGNLQELMLEHHLALLL